MVAVLGPLRSAAWLACGARRQLGTVSLQLVGAIAAAFVFLETSSCCRLNHRYHRDAALSFAGPPVGEHAIDLIELLEHNPKMIEASQKDHPINRVLKIAMAKAYGKRPHSKVEEVSTYLSPASAQHGSSWNDRDT